MTPATFNLFRQRLAKRKNGGNTSALNHGSRTSLIRSCIKNKKKYSDGKANSTRQPSQEFIVLHRCKSEN
jgi:hypothetical protein